MKNKLEKFGSFGAVAAAAACPICFPKLAILGALFGMGALAQYETPFFFGAQILVLLAVTGHALSYKKHRNGKLLSLAAISASLLFVSLYGVPNEVLSYLAFAGLIGATVWLVVIERRCGRCDGAADPGQ